MTQQIPLTRLQQLRNLPAKWSVDGRSAGVGARENEAAPRRRSHAVIPGGLADQKGVD